MNQPGSDLSKEVEVLLSFVNEITMEFATAAKKNMNKLEKLGISSEDLTKIAKQTKLDETISAAQENNTTESLLSDSSLLPNAADMVFQFMNEKRIQNDISRNIVKLQDQIKQLEECNSVLDREFKHLMDVNTSSVNKLSDFHELTNTLKNLENEAEKLRGTSEPPETEDQIGIVKEIKELNESIYENTCKLEKIEEQLSGYGDLPANLLLAQSNLNEKVALKKELEKKVNQLLKLK
ncbi:uncharacterized protein LOC142322304 isoform X2 [Lycorma delicatula]|uniref:uncharacterized protein LOC142322304 isoform X2 n=1 Tax=Lycorma delicatula TaxID=130591 RepID=UPI003F516A5E